MRTSVLLIALLSSPVAAQEAVSLKWSLKEGDKFFVKDVTVMDMNMTALGMTNDMKINVTVVERFKVISAKQDSTTIELTIVDIKITGAAGIPGLEGLGEHAQGATITAILDENMTVTKLQGYDKFLDKLSDNDEKRLKEMKDQFSEHSTKQMFSDVFSFGPNKPIKVGDDWQRTEKMSFGGLEASVKLKYKLESFTGGIAKLSYTGEPTFKADNGLPGLPEGFQLDSLNMKTDKLSGTMNFDPKIGRLTEATQDAGFNGTIGVSAGGQKLDIKMKIKVKSNVTVSEKNPVKD